MKRLAAALLIAFGLMPTGAALAAELVYVEHDGCYYCYRFNHQMAQAYAASATGKKVPLRPVELLSRWPEDLKGIDRPPYTPVFILVEKGRELGRFNGYSNPAQFNRDLRKLLEKQG